MSQQKILLYLVSHQLSTLYHYFFYFLKRQFDILFLNSYSHILSASLNTPLYLPLLMSLKFFYVTQFVEKYCFLSIRVKRCWKHPAFWNSSSLNGTIPPSIPFFYECSFSDHLLFSRTQGYFASCSNLSFDMALKYSIQASDSPFQVCLICDS